MREDDGQFHIAQNRATSGSQEGEENQQAIIFKDSIISNKHKRNKSLEGITEKSLKIARKRTKELLKRWNWKIFGNVFTTVEHAKQEADEAEKNFDRDSSKANLIALNKGTSTRNDNSDFPFQFSKLSQEDIHSISNIPTDEEIKDIVFSIDKDSVAGLDDFHRFFYHSSWDFINNDIQEAVRDFVCGTPMPRSFKATTIVLIPKLESPQTWNDFRPISLCYVTNKIMSKLLYKKLSHSLPNLISLAQSGFVTGRLISDNILIAQEIIHHLDLRYKNNNLVIKLDMSKAYDRVNWNFLLSIMEKMGFPTRFLTLIKHAVQNCWFTVLVNKETAGFSKSTSGLRQGDPISPALFIIVADALSKGIDHLFNGNPDMYFQTKCEVKISHLSYVDDVILFTNCKEAGRKANLIANRIKNITGFSMKALPITYLGAPLYKGNKRKVLYENLIDKVKNRISGWEHCHLSYGGRLQLIKTALSSMPIYLLQVLNPPNREKFTGVSGTLSATPPNKADSALETFGTWIFLGDLQTLYDGLEHLEKTLHDPEKKHKGTYFGAWLLAISLSVMIGGLWKAHWTT
ncbi:UNVERIFIED_CONTAM: hypothetical protein Scaly_2767800 [Sesamum calycinum]|uniref:Reverse transcriptase domain-containing protein n=1 Tax=Sesamum calycinum TaxID=2727403 RepID=A0AAW2IZE0_9LAMI